MLIFFTFFGRIIGVDGHSMDPTLNDQDMLYLSSFRYEPQQGDIVVLHKNFEGINKPIVKRVIAVGGQTVDINDADGLVYVDGVPLDEPYTNGLPSYRLPNSIANVTYPYTVPEGCFFVLGDYRTQFEDSRDFGPVPLEDVQAKVITLLRRRSL